MTTKNRGKIKKENSKDYSFFIKQKNSFNSYKSITLILLAAIFILSISSADTVQADEVIGNISDNSSDSDGLNDTNSSENTTTNLNKSEIVHSGTTVAYYIEKNKKLPDTISIGKKVITINQYLYAITSFIQDLIM